MRKPRPPLPPESRRADAGQARGRLYVKATPERLLWILLAIAVVAIAIVPLVYVFDAALSRETRIGLADERSFVSALEVYTSREYIGYLLNSLILAAAVTLLALVLGVAMAVLVARTSIPYRATLDLLIIMPLFMSPFTGLMAWIALGSEKSSFVNVFFNAAFGPLFGEIGPLMNIWSYAGIVWVMVVFFCPFAYLFTVGKWGPSNPRWLKIAMKVLKLPGGEAGPRAPYRLPDQDELQRFADGLVKLGIPEINEQARRAGLI